MSGRPQSIDDTTDKNDEESHPPVCAAATAAAASSMYHPMNATNLDAPLMEFPMGMDAPLPAKLRRLCRFPGCSKVVKSQGHCQRHGARTRRCRIEDCEKQAQGTHDGMCKRHWKEHHAPPKETAVETESDPIEPVGESAYDSLLPKSIAYRPVPVAEGESKVSVMPLVTLLKEGTERHEPGWHRNAERLARGIPLVSSVSVQLEAWEKQLVLVEILLLSGGTPYANFRHLAHAWGRERGFHHVLVNTVCSRRGEVERKKRKDAKEPPSDSKRPRTHRGSISQDESVDNPTETTMRLPSLSVYAESRLEEQPHEKVIGV